MPLMRPIFLEYPQATDFYGENREFLFGRDLLVAPVVDERLGRAGSRSSRPASGTTTGQTRSTRAPRNLRVTRSSIKCLSMFVPAQSCRSNLSCRTPAKIRTGRSNCASIPARIAAARSISTTDTRTRIRRTDSLRIAYTCQATANLVTVTSASWQGNYKPWWSNIQVEVFGAAHAAEGSSGRGSRGDGLAATTRSFTRSH